MTQWEPIAGSDIKVGDIISDVSYNNGYTLIEIKQDQNGRERYRIRFDDGRAHWYSKSVFRYIKSIGTEYDPKQQPWDDSDI